MHSLFQIFKRAISRRSAAPFAKPHTNFYQKEIKDIKEFVELARRADIKSAVVKVNKKTNANGKPFKQTKFKVRGTRYQYTLVVNDITKAKKLQQSLPPSLEIKTL